MRIKRFGRPVWALVLVLLLGASPAAATYETLKRSLGNIVFAPIDMALSPVVASQTIYRNLRDIDDSLGVRVAYVPMGIFWNTGVQAMSAIVREISGLIEFFPGLLVLPLEADLDPIFAPAERGDALFEVETVPLRLKFGVDYTTVPF